MSVENIAMTTIRDLLANLLEEHIHQSDWSEYENLPDVILASPELAAILDHSARFDWLGDLPDDIKALLEDWKTSHV